MDNYYKPIEDQAKDQNGNYNFDLPTALDEELLVSDLRKLVSGETIEVKEYHFNAPPDKNIWVTIQPSKLIIVEGLFLFHYARVRELLEYSIFVKVDPMVQLDRRLYRDQETRGYSREAILYQWENHVAPCYKNYLLPYEGLANFQFRNDANADSDFRLLAAEISKEIDVLRV